MHDGDAAQPNPYESPREHAYYPPVEPVWWPWLKDRLLLCGCGLVCFVAVWGAIMLAAYIAWRLGFIT
jgi:hypothetical protein